MKFLLSTAVAISGVAFAMSTIDLWSNLDADKYHYVGDWLGGKLDINSYQQDEDTTQLRIKMTGAGSIPQGTSEFFVTDIPAGSQTPSTLTLTKTNELWQASSRQDPNRNGAVKIDIGSRDEISGILQSYSFNTVAELIETENLLDLWSNLDSIPYDYVGEWLGGLLTINTFNLDNSLELRIKMTGAGSIPQGTSEYFKGSIKQGTPLPESLTLLKTNEIWVADARQNPDRNGSIALDLGNRQSMSGNLQGYDFDADAKIRAVTGQLDLWLNGMNVIYSYLGTWLGGSLDINAVNIDQQTVQIRVKMTGAGSIPQGTSEYFTTEVSRQAQLPLKSELKKTSSNWLPESRQDPARNGVIAIDLGNRFKLNGVLQSYSFDSTAVKK